MVVEGVDEDQIHLEETVVGQKLLNSIVTHVKVDVKDTDDKYQIKKWITLQNGVVLISEYWKEKAGEVYKSSESSIELPPDVLAEQQAKKDEARAKARELLQQRKKAAEKPKQEEEKPKPKKEMKPITVYSETDPDIPTSGEPHAIWKMPEEDKDECFEPQEIVLEENPDVTDESLPPTDEEDDQPQGVWGKQEDDDDDGPVIVLPPGKLKLPDSDDGAKFVPKGKWKPGKLNAKWPPPTKDPNNTRSVGKLKPFSNEEEETKVPRKVGKLKLPQSMQGDDWKPRRARIFPKKSDNDDDCDIPKKMRSNSNDNENDPIVGVWAPSSKDADNWAPVDVMVYPTKSNDDLDESKPCGIVAIKNDSTSNDDDTTNPGDCIFCPPDVETPDDCTPIGVWKPLPGKLNDTWPPPTRDDKPAGRFGRLKVPDCFQNDTFPPRRARVWPKSKADSSDGSTGRPKKLLQPDNGGTDDLIEGIWAPSSDPDADAYEPMDVIIHPSKPTDLDESKPHGIVAVSEDAKPDNDGHWKPQDFIFCPPATDAPDGSKPIGVWTPGKLNDTWPPPIDKSGGRKVGKLNVPSCFDGYNFKPRKARVFPRSKVDTPDGPKKFRPINDGDNVTGVWGTPKGKGPIDDSDWDPMDVMIHPSNPDDINESQPHGAVAIANTARADKDGSWDPKDMIFLPPNTEADKDKVTPIGIWKPAPGRLSNTWPPVSPSKKRNSVLVGKLPKWQSPGDWKSCNAVVTSRRHAPDQNSDDTPRGIWKVGRKDQSKRPSAAGTGDSDEDNWAPQTICMYQDGKEPAEIGRLPHGIWGTKPGAEPDAFGQWKPKDLWFYPPGESPDGDDEKNFVPRGKWSYPPEKSNAKWPPSPLNKSPTRVSVPKFEYWSGSKDISKESPAVGKLKVPGVFAKLASPTTGSPKKRTVGKLNIPKL